MLSHGLQLPFAGTSLTAHLAAWQNGQAEASQQVFELAYAQLRQIASQRLRGQSVNLSPTELIHEAVVRVLGTPPHWKDRAHFFVSMSLYMRAVLIDHLRAQGSDRRGGAAVHVTLSQAEVAEESMIADLLVIDRALTKLEALDPRSAAVLHLSYFAGLRRHEIAEVMEISVQIVDRELRFAKTWLNTQLDTAL